MKRFRFRLQKVLEYRTSVKDEHAQELARQNMNLFSAEEQLEGILKAQDEAQLPENGVTTMGDFLLSGNYQRRLRAALEEQRVRVLEATEAVDQARVAYIEKAVEAEALEVFKNRKFEEFRQETKKEERKALDELVVMRHGFQQEGK